jgi:hypothetical protein
LLAVRSGDEPSAAGEPAIGDDRSQRHGDGAGGAADHQPPQQVELPGCGHLRGQAGADGDQHQRDDHHPAHPEALDHRRREWRTQAVHEKVDGGGAADQCPRPAELLLQRHDQHTRRRPEAGGRDQQPRRSLRPSPRRNGCDG